MKFLGAPPENLALSLRPVLQCDQRGGTRGLRRFSRSCVRPQRGALPETFIFGYTFEDWRTLSGETKPATRPRDPLRWALGEEPALISFQKPTNPAPPLTAGGGWIRLISPLPTDRSMKVEPVSLAGDVKADLYLPTAPTKGKLPLVVWLHPYAHANGYIWKAKPPFVELIPAATRCSR